MIKNLDNRNAMKNTMNDIRLENLKRLIDQYGSQANLAKQFDGIETSYLSILLNKHRAFGERSARSMEEKLGLPSGWFDINHEKSQIPEETRQHIHVNTVPLYEWPEWNEVSSISKKTPLRKIICPVDDCSHNTYALIMRDDSMLAAGEHGQLCRDDIIFIDPEKEPRRDDYVMATSSKHQLVSIKKLIEQDGRQCLLTSNPTWQDRFILINDEIKLHGVVVAKSRIFV